MNRFLGAEFAAQQHVGAVGDHLVEVHVGLGAGTGLPDHQREVIVELAFDHLACGADDSAGAARIKQSEFLVGLGGGEFDDAEGMDDRDRHAIMADLEILSRALGLRAPIAVGRNVDRTEAVGLTAGGFVSGCFCAGHA